MSGDKDLFRTNMTSTVCDTSFRSSRRGARLVVTMLVAMTCIIEAQQRPPVFRTGVDLVQLDVVVTDKAGRPVTGLRQEDFVVTEQGRLQTIASFETVAIPPVRRSEVDDMGTRPSLDVVSNARHIDTRQWVLLVDDLHLIETNIVPTKRVIREFLTSLPSEDRVALVFAGRSDLSVDFTNDLGSLLRAADRLGEALGFAPDATNAQPWRERARLAGATVSVLVNIGKALSDSQYPRKALVYIGDGMAYGREDTHFRSRNEPPLDVMAIRDVFTQIDSMTEGLRKVGVPLYTLDPRGLVDCNAVRGPCSVPPRGNIRRQLTMLQEFAENTGGRAFVNQPDTLSAVRQIIEDNSHYYLLGYYPSATRRPGSFQEVKVRVRRAGLQVRARAGYMVPTTATGVAAPGQSLNRMLTSASLATGLDVRATASVLAVAEQGWTVAATAEVKYPIFSSDRENDVVVDELEFAVVALEHDGRVRGETRRRFEFTGRPGAEGVSVLINDIVDLPAEPIVMRLAVSSRATGLQGSVHIPIKAAAPNRADVMIGGVVIGRQSRPRPTVVLGALPNATIPIQPLTDRVFDAADVLSVWIPLFWRNDTEDEPQTVVRLSRDGVMVHEQIAALSPVTVVRGIAQAGASLELRLASLEPGRYMVGAAATLPRGSTSTASLAFEIR